MPTTNEIHGCEVCGSKRLSPALNLGKHPMCDDLVAVGDARTCVEYPIEILFCSRCRTAHQRYQVPKQELFPATYHYRSRFTADVLRGMQALVDSCRERIGNLRGKAVLDVGCNDGSLLDFFRQQGCKTIGIEPTGAFADAQAKGHDVLNDFFDERSAAAIVERHGRPDIVTFTNVFAHIEDLQQVIRALRLMVSAGSVIVVENHYLGAVLDRSQFDTFYHEHPRTYSVSSFVSIADALSMDVSAVEFPSRYGGNVRVFMSAGLPAADDLRGVVDREANYGGRLEELASTVDRWKRSMRLRLDDLVGRHGPLVAKAFPGRAAILIRLLGIDRETLGTVHEKPGSMKIGHYVPGTRIPICSDDDLFSRTVQPPVLINLAWHISSEIRAYLREYGYRGEVIDIFDPASL